MKKTEDFRKSCPDIGGKVEFTEVCTVDGVAMDDHTLHQQSAEVLEWPRVLSLLASLAYSPMGAERCRTLGLETGIAGARERLQETADMVALSDHGDPFPALTFPDLRQVIGRVMKGAVLEPTELRDCGVVLSLSLAVIKFLGQRKEQVLSLHAVAVPLEPVKGLQPLSLAIDRAVDHEGTIRETATPALRRLTHHAKDLKGQIRHRLESLLESRRYAPVLQERYFAQREGRYVVPIKADRRSNIPGIVHDVSASGATVFLEPRELVDLNNSIKVAELDVAREIRRMLQDFSTRVAEEGDSLLHAMDVLGTFDCLKAKAGLSRMVNGCHLTLNDQGHVALRAARHPLLVLAREDVVANDLDLDQSVRVLVISGPNTGGKTVTLKLIGIVALMVRAGLQPPCGPDSEMAFFPHVFADIGDAQDLSKDLSSFSAHMTKMIRLHRHALSVEAESGGSGPVALVLLDELATSTDPAEGEALAKALLLEFAGQRLTVVVTTHYNGLKLLAQSTPGFRNASVEFDVSRLAPTYRLLMGVPGGSSAIDIAGRLGMDEKILDHALSLVHREDRVLDQVLAELQETHRRLAEDQAAASYLRGEAEQSAREARDIADRLRLCEREERTGIKKKLTNEILRARAHVQDILDELQRDRTLMKAKDAKRRLATVEAQVQARVRPSSEYVPLEQLRAGDRVEVVGLGTTGTLLEAPLGRKRVTIRVGERNMSVASSQVLGVGENAPMNVPQCREVSPSHRAGGFATGVPSESDASVVLDLRGTTTEEALDHTVAALDRAVCHGTRWLRIIHGHGTGKLKSAVREYLRSSPYVGHSRPGERNEGGDGVTVVDLRTE